MLGLLSSSSSSTGIEETVEDRNLLTRFAASLLRMPGREDLGTESEDWDLVPPSEDEDYELPPPPPAPRGLESFFPPPPAPAPALALVPPPNPPSSSARAAAPAPAAADAAPARARPRPARRPGRPRGRSTKMLWFYPQGTKMTLHCLPSEFKLVQELTQDYDVDFPPEGIPSGRWHARMFSLLDCEMVKKYILSFVFLKVVCVCA